MSEKKTDYSRLKGKIREQYGSQKAFAEAIGVKPSGLSLRLAGKRAFKSKDIETVVEALGLTVEDIPAYFFTAEDAKTRPQG